MSVLLCVAVELVTRRRPITALVVHPIITVAQTDVTPLLPPPSHLHPHQLLVLVSV